MGSGATVDQTVRVRPSAWLAPSVARCVGYRYEGFAPGTHRGLPSRHLTVVLGLDAPTRTLVGSDRAPAAFMALVGGLHTRPVTIAHDGDLAGIQLDLTPEGARTLFGLPAAAIGGAVRPLDDLIGPRAGELVERLAEAPTWRTRFAVVEDVLSRGMAGCRDRRPSSRTPGGASPRPTGPYGSPTWHARWAGAGSTWASSSPRSTACGPRRPPA